MSVLNAGIEILRELGHPVNAGNSYLYNDYNVLILCDITEDGKSLDLDTFKIYYYQELVYSNGIYAPGLWEDIISTLYDKIDVLIKSRDNLRARYNHINREEIMKEDIRRQNIYIKYIVPYYTASTESRKLIDMQLRAHNLYIGKTSDTPTINATIYNPDTTSCYVSENGYMVYRVNTFRDLGIPMNIWHYEKGPWEKNLENIITTYQNNKERENLRLTRENLNKLNRL